MIAAGDRSVPITWRQFTDDIAAIAWVVRNYANSGTVALLGENSYEWMAAHAACVFSGATVVPVEVGLSAPEIADRLKFTGAVALIHSALYAEKAKEACRLTPGVQIGEFGSRRTDKYVNKGRAALASGERCVFDMPPPDDTRTAMIVFTSGTTSKPKGAEITLRGMAAFCEYAQSQLKVKQGDRSLMVLPVHHIFGVCAAYFMLSQGVALGVCPDFRRLYDTVERFRVNCICLVPALAEILAEKIAQRASSAEEAFGSPIDWILIGGAPLSRRIYEKLSALGIQPLTAYGLTETTALFSIAAIGEDPHAGSAGRACDLPGVEVKVSDDGILLAKGPNVFKGYYRDPSGTAKVLSSDGWFRTGDYGRIDEDGYVWVAGRASRTIVLSSGKKIAPEELEERILALPGIREAVVSGDGSTREIKAEIYAVIPESSVRKAMSALNGSLPVYKRVRTVVVRSEPFPRTDSGKIRIKSGFCKPEDERRRRIKTLQLVPAMEQGGVERGVVEVNRALVAEGWENVVVSSGGRLVRQIESDGGRHIMMDVKSKNPVTYFKRALELRRIIEREHPDVVCAHSRVPAWLFLWANRKLGVKWISFAHGANSVSRYSSVMTRGDLTVTPSRYIADYLKANYGLDEEKIRVIPRSIDRERFDVKRLDHAFIDARRIEWGIGRRKVVMGVGRITQLKGYDVLIKAVVRANEKTGENRFMLVIVGEAEELRRDVEEGLHGLVDRLHAKDTVVFAGNHQKIAECLSLADIVVSSNTRKPEAFGRSMAEALAMGRPVVAKAFGGALDIVDDGINGALVPADTPHGDAEVEAFADAIVRVSKCRFGDLRTAALEKFSFEQMMELTKNVYRELSGKESGK